MLIKKTILFIFQENYENSKGEIEGLEIHVDRDVKKSVQGDGKRNEYNCFEERVI
jgi:phage tail tube protein FII